VIFILPEDYIEFEERETYGLTQQLRNVFLFHDKYRLAPQEVAYIMNLSVKETLDILGSAREGVLNQQK